LSIAIGIADPFIPKYRERYRRYFWAEILAIVDSDTFEITVLLIYASMTAIGVSMSLMYAANGAEKCANRPSSLRDFQISSSCKDSFVLLPVPWLTLMTGGSHESMSILQLNGDWLTAGPACCCCNDVVFSSAIPPQLVFNSERAWLQVA